MNRLNQPVGPIDDVVIELSSFLGTLARNGTLCPFDIFDWRNMKSKKDLWDYMKEKYIIPEATKKWTLVTIQEAWRSHRSELKRTYYDAYDSDEVRMEKKPVIIQNVNLESFSNIGSLRNSRKCLKQILGIEKS